MNNGQPPYGDPSQWGQQPSAGQDPSAQFVPGQYPAQPGGYQQPYGQPSYGQQSYQQTWQPQSYQQPQAYQQPDVYQQQTYQPQMHQAQENYAQQTWQPYGQQPYAQQGYAQQYSQGGNPMYQQAAQNGQPLQQGYPQQTQEPVSGVFYPAQGYSGYVSSSRERQPGLLSGEVIVKVVLFGVLPVLLILGLVLKAPVLCWLFIAGAAGTVAAMWLKPLVDDNLRLVSSLVCGVLAVVALFTALNGAPGKDDVTNQFGGAQSVNAGQLNGAGTGMVMEPTATPTAQPTPTPDPYAEAGAAVEQLQSFFYFWHVNNDENMLALTAPSWRASVSNPAEELFRIRLNRKPLDDCEISISGSEADTIRTAKVKVSIDKNNGRDPERYSFNVIMVKEDGIWYVDPRSLESNEKATETTPATNPMPTQPVLNTGAPNLYLYYNPDGGSKYHIDPNCDSTHDRYKPMKGQFLFSQLNDAPYSELEQCSVCGAPLRVK